MPEVQKYNLKEKLLAADRKYAGDPAVSGMSSLTNFRYNNSTRTQMFTAHMNQMLNQPDPEFPLTMTGAENTVGRNSSGYTKLKSDIEIFRKVEKFKDIVEHPFVYQLFYWDKRKNRYDVKTRKHAEDLGQNYGYLYNNEKIDSLEEGDSVPKGTVLTKSTSYDPYMNYRFGTNLNCMYSFEPFTSEDAAIIDKYASVKLSTIHSQKITWGWNINDIPLNIFGNDDIYQPLQNLGGYVEGYVASSRPKINEQMLFDLQHRNLSQIRDGDRTVFYSGKGQIVDYDIYCNNDDLPDNSFYKQIRVLLDSQTQYWQEIQDTCVEIINSGKDYSAKVDRLYDRSMKFIDSNPNRKWNNGNSVFGNIEIRAHIVEISPLEKGGKFTARYGNKSVVSKVVDVSEMPFSADGKRVHVILNQPAITNRTTGFVPHEMEINWITELAVDQMKKMKTLDERETLYFDILEAFNKEECAYFHKKYSRLTKKEKTRYMNEVMEKGIVIYEDSINEDESIFFKIRKLYKKYDWIKPVTLFVRKWGHIYRISHKYSPGKMYFIPLKQTDSRGFSARNTGAINMKELPERSYKNKRNESPVSDTAIRFGEYESMNFLTGLEPEELAIFHAAYRSSPEATTDLTKAQFIQRGIRTFKKFYKSRTAEIFSVYYKHLGLELNFIDKNKMVKGIDNESIKSHIYKGKTYMMTDYEFYEMTLKDKIRSQILEENVIMNGNELDKKVDEEMTKGTSFIIGPRSSLNAYGSDTLPEAEADDYIPYKKKLAMEEEARRKKEEEALEKDSEETTESTSTDDNN